MTHTRNQQDKNRELYQAALELGLAQTPTEFWTLVRTSGQTAENLVKMATSRLEVKPRWVSQDADDACQCPFCGARWGAHHSGCPDA